MILGETVLSGAEHPKSPIRVLESGAGWYLGFTEENGIPYTRETVYMTEEKARELYELIRR